MILVIDLCKEALHYFEFVKPVEDILENAGIENFSRPYFDVGSEELKMADKVIICGTSLEDFDFVKNINKFSWIKNFEKPVLGICAGMQVIGFVYEGKSKKSLEIGFFKEKFSKELWGLKGDVEVYHVHQSFVDFSKLKEFEIYSGDKIAQAVKHKEKEIYGVLFHPEVRNKEMILGFSNG